METYKRLEREWRKLGCGFVWRSPEMIEVFNQQKILFNVKCKNVEIREVGYYGKETLKLLNKTMKYIENRKGERNVGL